MKGEAKIDVKKSCVNDFLQTTNKTVKNQILRRSEQRQKAKAQFNRAKPFLADAIGPSGAMKT
jgi:hypothetical protein